jgi:glycosyltransferase involved in cell wall biosynthesis
MPGIEFDARPYRPPTDPAVVVIAGRVDAVKNNLNHVLASRLTGRPLRLVFATRTPNPVIDAADALGVPHEARGYLPHDEWLDLLRGEADLVLCCSLAESFGYVAAEAMQAGVPVIASPAIRFADPTLVADPSDARDIARKIDAALGDYRDRCRRAAHLGGLTLRRQRAGYLAGIRRILETPTYGVQSPSPIR